MRVLPPHPRPLSPVGGEGCHSLVISFQCSVASESWVCLVLSVWAHAELRRREGRGRVVQGVWFVEVVFDFLQLRNC